MTVSFHVDLQADSYQKTGCYNVLCPGFVQVSMQIPLGLILRPTSVLGGPQYDIILKIYQVNHPQLPSNF